MFGSRGGGACDAAACPVLLNERSSRGVPVAGQVVDRRAVGLSSAVAAAMGTSVVIAGAATAVAGRLIDSAPKPKGQAKQLAPITTTPTTTTTTPGATTTTVTQVHRFDVGTHDPARDSRDVARRGESSAEERSRAFHDSLER